MAGNEPEFTREMFSELFDERIDVYKGIDNFKSDSKYLFEEYRKDNENSRYQDERAISTCLWLRYPDKYYIYQFKVLKNVGEVLLYNYTFKPGKYEDNIKNFYRLYDEICA